MNHFKLPFAFPKLDTLIPATTTNSRSASQVLNSLRQYYQELEKCHEITANNSSVQNLRQGLISIQQLTSEQQEQFIQEFIQLDYEEQINLIFVLQGVTEELSSTWNFVKLIFNANQPDAQPSLTTATRHKYEYLAIHFEEKHGLAKSAANYLRNKDKTPLVYKLFSESRFCQAFCQDNEYMYGYNFLNSLITEVTKLNPTECSPSEKLLLQFQFKCTFSKLLNQHLDQLKKLSVSINNYLAIKNHTLKLIELSNNLTATINSALIFVQHSLDPEHATVNQATINRLIANLTILFSELRYKIEHYLDTNKQYFAILNQQQGTFIQLCSVATELLTILTRYENQIMQSINLLGDNLDHEQLQPQLSLLNHARVQAKDQSREQIVKLVQPLFQTIEIKLNKQCLKYESLRKINFDSTQLILNFMDKIVAANHNSHANFEQIIGGDDSIINQWINLVNLQVLACEPLIPELIFKDYAKKHLEYICCAKEWVSKTIELKITDSGSKLTQLKQNFIEVNAKYASIIGTFIHSYLDSEKTMYYQLLQACGKYALTWQVATNYSLLLMSYLAHHLIKNYKPKQLAQDKLIIALLTTTLHAAIKQNEASIIVHITHSFADYFRQSNSPQALAMIKACYDFDTTSTTEQWPNPNNRALRLTERLLYINGNLHQDPIHQELHRWLT